MQTEIVNLGDRNIAVVNRDDVGAILDNNARLRGISQKSDWGRHVASIPNIIMVKWLNEEWQRGNEVRYLSPEWDKIVERKLRDPEWAYLRVDGPQSHVGWGK